MENLHKEYKLEREAYDKYYLLDSKKYLPLLIIENPLSFTHQICVVHFVIFSVLEGKITRSCFSF